jgi:hypothetical protein
VVNSYPCPECMAGPGQACRTAYQRPKPEPHAARAAVAHSRGWADADEPARCFKCQGPLPGVYFDATPRRCPRCSRIGPPSGRATADNPGPDGSYDVPLWEES